MTAPTGLCPTHCTHAEANTPCPDVTCTDMKGRVVGPEEKS